MNKKLGDLGENIAIRYLSSLGWFILFKNYRLRFGEIDVVARDTEGILCFIEVKTSVRLRAGLVGEDHLTRKKLRKLQQLAVFFANSHQHLIGRGGWRIDLVAIAAERDILTNNIISCKVKLYRNLF